MADRLAGLRLRAATEDDSSLVAALWAEARAIDALGLPAQLAAMQWHAWCAHVQTHYTQAQTFLVELEQAPVGFVVWQAGSPAHLLEIGVTHALRGQGVGSWVVKTLMSDSPQGMTLLVDPLNPAKGLYERLGFRPVGVVAERIEMAWPGINP